MHLRQQKNFWELHRHESFKNCFFLVKLKVEITKEIQQIFFFSPKVAASFFTIKYILFYDNILSSTD